MSAGDVFIVDDNPNNLGLLASILRGAGYRVRMSNEPSSALAMLQALPPELLMVDVMMPGMDGYELCREIKAQPATASLPVIFLSALSEPVDKVRAFEAGGVDYVAKPFDAGEVLARVDCQLRLARLQRELATRNEELARLNEVKNRFLGMAAHDLRSPLTVALGYAELLRDGNGQARPQAAAAILRQGEFMLRLVNDLLDVAAIEAGQVQVDLHTIDLGEVAAAAVELNRGLATPKGVEVTSKPAAGRLDVHGDAIRIQQVFNNLIGNAVKFSPPRTVVTVTTDRSDQEACVTVADQGPGIPPAQAALLFEPFRRGAAKPTGGEASTGLGLAIARKIVEAHHGRIWVESEPGRGARFCFSVPLARS